MSYGRGQVDAVFALVGEVQGDAAANAQAMAAIAALPCWDVPVEIAPLPGGLSNLNFTAVCGGARYVVRYGADDLTLGVRRANEAAALRAGAAVGVAPGVHHAEGCAIVMHELEGEAATPAALASDPDLLARVAAALRTLHHDAGRALDGPDFVFWPYHHGRWYVRQILGHAERLAPAYVEAARALGAEVNALEAAIGPRPVVFGHGDLVPGNVFVTPEGVRFIDLEYAGFGPDLFDLAGLGMNAELSDAQAAVLLEAYFGAPADADLMRRYAAMVLVASIREATWCLKKLLSGSAVAFDYRIYADMCLERHARLRARYDAMEG